MSLHAEAWRILLHAVAGRELLPTHAADYAKRAVAKTGATLHGEVLETGRAASSAAGEALAEAGPAKKSRAEGPGSASLVALKRQLKRSCLWCCLWCCSGVTMSGGLPGVGPGRSGANTNDHGPRGGELALGPGTARPRTP